MGVKGIQGGKKIDKVNAIVSTNDGLREWAARIKDCQNRPTGMSITDWCKNQGIKESRYYYWFYRVKKVCPEVVQGEMPIQQETIVQSELSEAVQGETSIRQVIPLQPVLLRQQEQEEGTPQQGVDISVKGLTIHVTESNQEACSRLSLCCCPCLIWRTVAVIAARMYMVVGDISEFFHDLV